MSRKSKKTKEGFSSFKKEFNNEIYGIFIIAFGLILLTALHSSSSGKIGGGLKFLLMGLFANLALVLPYAIVFLGILVFIDKPFWKELKGILFFILIFLCFLVFKSLLDINFIKEISQQGFFYSIPTIFTKGTEGLGGGIIGTAITYLLVNLFGQVGSYIVIIAILLISLIMYTKISIVGFIVKLKVLINKILVFIKSFISRSLPLMKNNSNDISPKLEKDSGIPVVEDERITIENNVDEKIKILDYTVIDNNYSEKENAIKEKEAKAQISISQDEPSVLGGNNYHQKEHIEYELPNSGLLNEIDYIPNKEDKKKIVSKARLLEETLKNFGVQAKVLQVSKGPTITRYELQPSTGVKVSKIVNLSDDIALNLAASAIRIEAPIPGKAAIGIEIPNEDITTVTLRELIDSECYQSFSHSLPFALGKDISGAPIVTDISKMPHLLIAGATGSGKSVCINTLILSLLYKSKPEKVRLLLIDPKVVELNQYNGIPHLLIPVVTDAKKATSALNWAVQEMTQRYKIFGELGVKDINGYNEKFEENPLPYIVIIIDELADLMLVAPNDVEDAICRLAQMARAAGMHLIIATQRPSVDVITGVIKANIPSRIAFSVASQADSRTILDMGGAEKLLGKGDMLFHPIGASKPVRIQGAFVGEKEVERVVTFIKEQIENPSYETEIVDKIDNNSMIAEDINCDELFDDALKIVVENQQASISMLQRKLKIGYNRAARLIDDMEARGIVGPHEGSKPRQVLVTQESLLAKAENE
ncbi:DNA translocase FtsK [Natronincola ferrireducens]|uniref:DNA translocase FtsK n=1 Tax=Natronincola ferrireducens TaxID=393762 RepID=A0A1G9C732_9FIRM|nr:DNA translocase FtsK [Natronincola ferrireducens]SDK47469.1 DNA translocase FtsK [Natronincola ferrireducens]